MTSLAYVRVPCISLNHLAPNTLAALYLAELDPGEVPEWLGMFAPHDNGYFLTVPSDETQALAPADLQTIYKFMESHAPHGWFLLDVDGDVCPDLPTYGEK